jgi:hypothetical protein
VFESFADPLIKDKNQKNTILELRAPGRDGGAHQTIIPPSTADGERREWHDEIIAPFGIAARILRQRCAWLATACLVRRYVSEHASEHPQPDLPNLLYEADHDLGRAAFKWLGLPDPKTPAWVPKARRDYTRTEIDLAEVVAAIPNNHDWHGWNRIGMAIFAASNGSDQGGIIFDAWSAKSPKYNPYETIARWRHWHRSPPARIGIGTLIHEAKQAGWVSPRTARAAR